MSADWFKKNRIGFITIIMTLFFVALIFRLSWIQLVRGADLSKKAVDVRASDELLDPRRGSIYDRNHVELVGNYPVKTVYANPDIFSVSVKAGEGEDKREKEETARENAVREIAAILSLDEANTMKAMSPDHSYVVLKRNVDFETSQKLERLLKEKKVSGIGFIEGTRRFYSQGSMAAHVLGFVGMDPSARGGIEKNYDSELSGVPGRLLAEKDASGRDLPQTKSKFTPPVPGKNLVLTIDRTIQYYVERELDRLEEKHKPSRSAIIVMDPATGEILAMGARPTYDPSRYTEYPQTAWDFNPALRFNYEPGSTFKVFVAAAALEEGTVREGDMFNDPGYISVMGKKIRCWDWAGHGLQTFAEGIMNSCNPVFAEAGLRSGKALIYKYISGFGFGKPTGVDLPGEESGLVIPEGKATDLDLATISIGQSIAVTPIQLVTALSSIANGGYMVKPHLVRAVEDQETKSVTNIGPQVVRQVISKETSSQLTRILQRVVLEGTAKKAYIEGYAVAGKTGTAEVPGQTGYQAGKYVSSFAGFVPADKPRIAVLVMVAEPKGEQYHGGDIAAPAFQTVARDTLQYLNLPENPDLPKQKKIPGTAEKPAESQAPGLVRVPNVIGFPLEDARTFLEESGLRPDVVGKQGLISEQKPAGGSFIKRGSVVSIWASSSSGAGQPGGVLVPDMKGLTIRRAGTVLRQLDLDFRAVGSGIGVNQTPRPGERVPKGTPVTVEFAPPRKMN
ncbi:MAG: penicillin-binding transpeptidase domain-containing protein [Bacillota bacterium]